MASLFEDLKIGLEEAIAYEKGNGKARKRSLKILPVTVYDSTEIRQIRMKNGMSQAVFAEYFGVSKKTVESWESGRTHPTGPACRLLELLDKDEWRLDSIVEM